MRWLILKDGKVIRYGDTPARGMGVRRAAANDLGGVLLVDSAPDSPLLNGLTFDEVVANMPSLRAETRAKLQQMTAKLKEQPTLDDRIGTLEVRLRTLESASGAVGGNVTVR